MLGVTGRLKFAGWMLGLLKSVLKIRQIHMVKIRHSEPTNLSIIRNKNKEQPIQDTIINHAAKRHTDRATRQRLPSDKKRFHTKRK